MKKTDHFIDGTRSLVHDLRSIKVSVLFCLCGQCLFTLMEDKIKVPTLFLDPSDPWERPWILYIVNLNIISLFFIST